MGKKGIYNLGFGFSEALFHWAPESSTYEFQLILTNILIVTKKQRAEPSNKISIDTLYDYFYQTTSLLLRLT